MSDMRQDPIQIARGIIAQGLDAHTHFTWDDMTKLAKSYVNVLEELGTNQTDRYAMAADNTRLLRAAAAQWHTADQPRGHGKYLVWDPWHKKIRLFEWYALGSSHRWYDEEDNQFHGDITHWMELPTGPVSP